jgi:hexosaminidase
MMFRELAALTPGLYLHVGGDEALSTPKAAYKTFIERVEAMVSAHGKQMVGWEEIAQCDLPASAIIQYWKDVAHAEMAVEKGMD